MINCAECGQKFKTSQALGGHKRFKHDSDFIKAKISGNLGHERILINGRSVVKVSELGLNLNTLSRVRSVALQKEFSDDELVNDMLDKFELMELAEGFKPIRCAYCYKISWQPEDAVNGKRIMICPLCLMGAPMILKPI